MVVRGRRELREPPPRENLLRHRRKQCGYPVADGTLEGTVITCPRHGSQFDVITGARERGPSDLPIRTYRVVADGDATFVDVPR